MIPFNKPYFTGNETKYIKQAIGLGKTSGNGIFTRKCQKFFEEKYGFRKCLLTNSCTDALEMAAILLGIQANDEVIMPSYTFVSTANAFILRGARIVFADSRIDTPGIDENEIEKLISPKTKAIVIVHYAGIACGMDKIMGIANNHNIFVVEDAAHAIDSYYSNFAGIKQALGSIGHLATFSFHETKNIISGEGGMIVINDKQFENRAEIIWEKGTNRSSFFRGEIDKYGWVDIGSSFLPSEITAAFLLAQLENFEKIQNRRIRIWKKYYSALKELEMNNLISLPNIPSYATNNAHIFYLICKNDKQRNGLIKYLKKYNIMSVFHYLPLHKSIFYKDKHDGRILPNADRYANTLIRLPMYYELSDSEIKFIIEKVQNYFTS